MTDVISVSPPRPAGVVADAVEGGVAVHRLLPEYEQLAERCRLPVTARAAWVRAQLEADRAVSPWAAVVRDRRGALVAAAILLDRPGRLGDGVGRLGLDEGVARVVLAGGGDGYRAGVAAADVAGARLLGVTIARRLALRAPRHVLDLGPLPDDACSGALADGLGADVRAVDPVPFVRRDRGGDVSAYLSHGTRKTLRKARNRMVTDGLDHSVRFTDDPDEVAALLPYLETAYRDRDHEHGLPCALDTPVGLALWRGRIQHLLGIGSLEVATLSIGGQPVAYVAGVRDGRRYGVLEGRFLTAWARYAPGRLLEAEVLQRVLADDRLDELDWMTGIAPETLLVANDVEPCVALRSGGGRSV
jgi:hypothetical protein